MPSDLGQNSGSSSGRFDVRGGILEPALCSSSWSACSGVQSQHWEWWDTTQRDKNPCYVRQRRKQGGISWLNLSRDIWEESITGWNISCLFSGPSSFLAFLSEFTCFFCSCIPFFSPPFLQEAQWKHKGEQSCYRGWFSESWWWGREEADLKLLRGKGLLPACSASAVGSDPAASSCLSLTEDGSSI